MWLVSLFVNDVNLAASAVKALNGKVLAGPMDIKGRRRIAVVRDFEDFVLVIAPVGLIGIGIKFVASPLQVPLQTIFEKSTPAEASDIMTIELGLKTGT